jgi:hypothetical protein
MGTSRERYPTDYIASPLAVHERAVALALELRMMDFSPQTVAFELSQFHGFAKSDAARIVREAAARDLEATEAEGSSSARGARDGRRWLDLSGVLPDATPGSRSAARH